MVYYLKEIALTNVLSIFFMERSYRGILAYDGTSYAGWQQQREYPSLASTFEEIFERLFNEKIVVHGASRTDAGVHAHGQVIMFRSARGLDPDALLRILNQNLPSALYLRSLEQTDPDFFPRHRIKQKTYIYSLTLRRPLPWQAPYVYHSFKPLNETAFRDALALFEGTHNFAAFSSTLDHRQTLRTVDTCSCTALEAGISYQVTVQGKGFLHHMIRRMIGGALSVSAGEASLKDISTLLNDPSHTLRRPLFNAPPHGLMLWSVEYDPPTQRAGPPEADVSLFLPVLKPFLGDS